MFNLRGARGGKIWPQIDQSAIMEADDSTHMYVLAADRGTPTSVKQFALHKRVKRTELGSNQVLFYGGNPAGSVAESVRFDSSDRIQISCATAATYDLVTTQVFRDTTNHYDILVVFDIENVTSTERIRLYVNGSRVTDFGTNTYPATTFNSEYTGNTASTQFVIGSNSQSSPSQHLCGIISDAHLLDGEQPTPDDFGEFDPLTPIYWRYKGYTGSYGTNGARWDFSDAEHYGKDVSTGENLVTAAVNGWSWTGSGTTSANGTDPLGNATFTFADTNGSGTSNIGTTFSGTGWKANTKYCASVDLKYIDSKTVYMDVYGSGLAGGATVAIYAHPEDGTISLNGSNDPDEYGSVDLGNGYYRFWWTFTTAASSPGCNMRLYPSWNASAKSTSGVGSDTGSVEAGSAMINSGSSVEVYAATSSYRNNLIDSGFTTANQVTDTPTNNYMTLNPLDCGGTITDGALNDAGGASVNTHSYVLPTTGKWVWELTATNIDTGTATAHTFGICDARVYESQSFANHEAISAITQRGGALEKNGASASTGTAIVDGNVVRFEFDADNLTLDIFVNGTQSGSQITGLTDIQYKVWAQSGSGSLDMTWNFGQRDFAGTPTTGYKALSAANIEEAEGTATILDPESNFVSALDTEANIVATLAAARSGWTSYIDIFKNRSNIESWYWRFSADSSNCFNSDTTDAKESFPTLAGSDDWIGFSLRLDGTANIKGGSVSHTNGADTTVTHNAGNARCMIVLFHTLGGVRHLYHPDLDAGKLIYLDAATVQTTDAAIKNVTANSFDIDTGEATDTIWYLVVPETAGFFDLGYWTGNANVDGPYADTGLETLWFISKNADNANNWDSRNSETEPANPANDNLAVSLDTAETAGSVDVWDITSRGLKVRYSGANLNGSGQKIVYVAFGRPALRSNAR